MDDNEEIQQENEDLKLDVDDLRQELDDIKQDAFFKANELRQKLDEANEEIEQLKLQLKNSGPGGGSGPDGKEEVVEESSFDTASHNNTHNSIISHDSTQGSKATTATRLELDRATREIKSLKLELVYAKSKAKESRGCSSGSSQISSGLSSAVSALSANDNDNDSEAFVSDLRYQIERLYKEVKFCKMSLRSEKNKSEREKNKLLQEIDRLQRINMFNTKEISKLNEQCSSKDGVIKQSKQDLAG